MEFLLFQGPWSGRGMTWENTIQHIQNLHDVTDWGGTEVTVVSGQCTIKQSKIDLANTREYHRTRTLEWMATAEGRLWALAIEKTKSLVPSPRGWGYTHQADRYFTQKFARTLATEPTLHSMRPASSKDYHSTCEPSWVWIWEWGVRGFRHWLYRIFYNILPWYRPLPAQ